VELYVNGVLYESRAVTTRGYMTQWDWQPGTPGTFLLVARAVDLAGDTGMSNAVIVSAGDALGVNGEWGAPVEVRVFVGEISPTPTSIIIN
jgi:hypothetical protein